MKITVTEYFRNNGPESEVSIYAETENGSVRFHHEHDYDRDVDNGHSEEKKVTEYASWQDFVAAGYIGDTSAVAGLLDCDERQAIRAAAESERNAAREAGETKCQCSDGTYWLLKKRIGWKRVDEETYMWA